MPTNLRGFTLLELMIALAIFALTALFVLEKGSASVRHQIHLEEKTFATWVAENSLAELRLKPYWPSLGTEDQTIRFAERDWYVRLEVATTPKAQLRKVIAQVRTNPQSENPVATLNGYFRERG